MPGIMPMKIIKVGSNSQSRVAQACDRCRSKKIRCDGITPCCTQCANVGFECKTSDKLSRRAFPRGYTESLEERVRQLEAEVRDLKCLLDEKDEKIDLLSKFHNFGNRRRSETSATAKPAHLMETGQQDGEECFVVRQPNTLTKTSSRMEPHWAGASSSTAFLDVFKEKAAAVGRAVPLVSPRVLFSGKDLSSKRPAGGHARRPPRLVSDRLVNLFFQEFAPLLPVLYRPAFLQRYREFAEGTDNTENHHAVAQLNLVFSIASTACDFGKEPSSGCDLGKQHVPAFDSHWQTALNAVIHDNSLSTLQCLVLAQLCCLCKGDSNRVLHYAGLGVIMSRRLGLHQTQAALSLEALTTEMRKRVFWCLYTLDTFTAASLGLPRLIKDDIVQTELPVNVDDEDLIEQRLTATTIETKMSVALSFFSLTRIFARTVDTVYQVPMSSGVSVQTVSALSEDLDAWHESLAPHLRLVFAQDKPSTRITGDRSALLSLAYYHIRALIHRPLATSDLNTKASPSVIALAEASKHIVQIVQLLDERHMGFCLPLHRNEVLVNAGLGLLYQGLTIPDGKSLLVNDSQRLVCAIISILDNSGAPCAHNFKALACSLIIVDVFAQRRSSSKRDTVSPRAGVTHGSPDRPKSLDGGSQRRASTCSSGSTPHASIAQRRSQQPGKLFLQHSATAMFVQQQSLMAAGVLSSRSGLTPMRSEPSLRKPSQNAVIVQDKSSMFPTEASGNLDYLCFGNTPSPGSNATPTIAKQNQLENTSAQWERILDCLTETEHMPSSFMPPSTGKSSPMDIFGSEQLGLDQHTEAAWQDPASATTWGTETTSVPSVFDDSGASFTSGEESSNSDMGGNTSKDMPVFTTAIELTNGPSDEFTTGLQGLEVGITL